MGERREKRKKNNKSYQEFQTSQPPKIVGGCNCDTYVATSESILQPPVATQGCDFSQPKKTKVATKFLQPPSPAFICFHGQIQREGLSTLPNLLTST